MGFFRFRRSIKILPGVRWNLNKGSSSFTFGGRGLKHTVGSKGSRTTVGLPGTGISYTQIHKRPAPQPSNNTVGSAKAFYIAGIIFLGIWLLGKLGDLPPASSQIAMGTNTPSPVEIPTIRTVPSRKTGASFQTDLPSLATAPSESIAIAAPSTSFTVQKEPLFTPSPTPLPKSEIPRHLTNPRSLPTGYAADAAKSRAIARYPQLAVAGSPLNSAFVARVRRYQVEKPQVFDDPEWPTQIARECEAQQ